MSDKKTFYIAGPMRGLAYFNFNMFDVARDRLVSLGHNVISPADLDRETGFDPFNLPSDTDWNNLDAIGFDLHSAVRRDVEAVMKCNAIVLLPGWQKSKGAMAEYHLAKWLGLEVFEWRSVNLPLQAISMESKQ